MLMDELMDGLPHEHRAKKQRERQRKPDF
jgi:hypothetical protein